MKCQAVALGVVLFVLVFSLISLNFGKTKQNEASIVCPSSPPCAPATTIRTDLIEPFSENGNITIQPDVYTIISADTFAEGSLTSSSTSGTGLIIDSTTDSTAIGTGAVVIQGGVSIAKTLYSGLGLVLPSTDATGVVLLDYYETVSTAATFTGPFNSPVNVNLRITRIGAMVTVTFPQITGTCTVATTATGTSAIPTRFSPPSGGRYTAPIQNSGSPVAQPGLVFVSGVNVVIARTLALDGFTAASTCGLYSTSISWAIN